MAPSGAVGKISVGSTGKCAGRADDGIPEPAG